MTQSVTRVDKLAARIAEASHEASHERAGGTGQIIKAVARMDKIIPQIYRRSAARFSVGPIRLTKNGFPERIG